MIKAPNTKDATPSRASLRDRAADVTAAAARVLKRPHIEQQASNAVSPSAILDLRDRWRAATEAVNRPGLPDDVFQGLLAQATEAERAVLNAPIVSVQDLACKVEVLRSNFDHHSLDEGLPLDALQAVCQGVDVLAAITQDRDLYLAKAQADAVNLEGLDVSQSGNLFDMFEAVHIHWLAVGCQPFAEVHDPVRGVTHNAAGKLAEQEAERAAHLRDRIADRVRQHHPATDYERDGRLTVLIKDELLCEGRILDRDLLLEAVKAWG